MTQHLPLYTQMRRLLKCTIYMQTYWDSAEADILKIKHVQVTWTTWPKANFTLFR